MLLWTFTGQPVADWPAAVRGTNFATDPGHTGILIHQFEGKLEIRRGDVLGRSLTGEFFVQGRPERLHPPLEPFVLSSGAVEPVDTLAALEAAA